MATVKHTLHWLYVNNYHLGFFLKTAYAVGPGRAQHVTHPALGPGRVFVWVTWLAQFSVSTKINQSALVKLLRSCQCLRQCASLPSPAVTPAHSAQAVQLWPTKSSRLGTRRSRAAITFTARSRTAIITARQASYVISRALDRIGTSCVRVLGTPTQKTWAEQSISKLCYCSTTSKYEYSVVFGVLQLRNSHLSVGMKRIFNVSIKKRDVFNQQSLFWIKCFWMHLIFNDCHAINIGDMSNCR